MRFTPLLAFAFAACAPQIASMKVWETASADGPTNWQTRRMEDPITRQPTVHYWVMSEDRVDCGWNDGGYIQLAVLCRAGGPEIFLNTGCHMTDIRGYGSVEIRIDEATGTVRGIPSTDNEAIFLPAGVLGSILGRREMVTRFTAYGESPSVARFDVTGLANAMVADRAACGL